MDSLMLPPLEDFDADVANDEAFVEEFLDFVMKVTYRGISGSDHGPVYKSFTMTASSLRAVNDYILEKDIELRNIFNLLMTKPNISSDFKDFLAKATREFCARSFSEKEFLRFCCIVSSLAVLGYFSKCLSCVSHAVSAILFAIHVFRAKGQFTSDSWTRCNRVTLLD